MSPCYSNLVLFDPLKPLESADTVIPELAERVVVAGQLPQPRLLPAEEREVARRPAVHLARREVHLRRRRARRPTRRPSSGSARARTGTPTSRPSRRPSRTRWCSGSSARSRRSCSCSPRATPRSTRRTCRSAELRQQLRGHRARSGSRSTRAGSPIELERNPDYFVPDRPYLDGIRYTDHHRARHPPRRAPGRPSRRLRAARDDQGDGRDGEEGRARRWSSPRSGQNGSDNVVINHKRPPFDNPAVRRAVSLAMDRHGYRPERAPRRRGGRRRPDAEAPRDLGPARPGPEDAARLPRAAPPTRRRPGACSPPPATDPAASPCAWSWSPAPSPIYLDVASFVADQLHQVGIEATVKQMDSGGVVPGPGPARLPDRGQSHRRAASTIPTRISSRTTSADPRATTRTTAARRRTGSSTSSPRSWTAPSGSGSCSTSRSKLEADVARPMLGWRKEYFAHWPHVKNLVPHNALYNYGRMQDVWLDR